MKPCPLRTKQQGRFPANFNGLVTQKLETFRTPIGLKSITKRWRSIRFYSQLAVLFKRKGPPEYHMARIKNQYKRLIYKDLHKIID